MKGLHAPGRAFAWTVALLLILTSVPAIGASGWFRPPTAMRGITLGPIESRIQPGRGYGSAAYQVTLGEVKDLGANWISLTAFGRVSDLDGTGVDPSFEAPRPEVEANIRKAVQMAHAAGLRVLFVPHLWVETGRWRAEINPGSELGWQNFERSYRDYLLRWAIIAEESHIDLLAAGVELRFWVTSSRAATFADLLREVRQHYHGALTYAANWDDADDTLIWRHVDKIGVNGFYPLHWENSPSQEMVLRGGIRAKEKLEALSKRFMKPVFLSEFGYLARKDTMVEPWLWPEQLGQLDVDEPEQARAYAALLQEVRRARGLEGVFLWRMYADVSDLSQEPGFGYSPWGKQAEAVLRSAYRARFSHDARRGVQELSD